MSVLKASALSKKAAARQSRKKGRCAQSLGCSSKITCVTRVISADTLATSGGTRGDTWDLPTRPHLEKRGATQTTLVDMTIPIQLISIRALPTTTTPFAPDAPRRTTRSLLYKVLLIQSPSASLASPAPHPCCSHALYPWHTSMRLSSRSQHLAAFRPRPSSIALLCLCVVSVCLSLSLSLSLSLCLRVSRSSAQLSFRLSVLCVSALLPLEAGDSRDPLAVGHRDRDRVDLVLELEVLTL